MGSIIVAAVYAALPAYAYDNADTTESPSEPVFSREMQLAPCASGSDTEAFFTLVNVTGLKSGEGNIRVQIYSDEEDEFLKGGKKLVRVDVPSAEDEVAVCVPLPGKGTFAMVVLHDRNANGKADFFSEGFGFSNNPRFVLSPPDHEKTLFEVVGPLTEMTISISYMIGGNEKKRRRKRR